MYIVTNTLSKHNDERDFTLYLDYSVSRHNLMLCISNGWSALCLHLTSDPPYMEWLLEHYASLMLINSDKWYDVQLRYHPEFQYTIEKLLSSEICS